MITAEGTQTRVILTDDRITIIKKGIFGREKSNRTIERSAISGIDFKKHGRFSMGSIEIHTGQAESYSSRPTFAGDRPNCITYLPAEAPAFTPIATELNISDAS